MKIALAFSGGLDTSVMVKWLQEHYDAEVVTVTGDLGQQKELIGVEEKAKTLGVVSAHILDLRDEFVHGYILPALKAGALYEGSYPMATALGRPLLAKALVDVARQTGCDAVAHGCTGKGNDQVRFEASVAALAPELKVLAPVRNWEFRSREEEIAYCQTHGIPVAATTANPYSIDENIWGTSIECGVLEDPMAEPPEDAYQRTVSPMNAPDEPCYVTIEFAAGIPVALNGVAMEAPELIASLNTIAGANGVGRIDLVENRLVGIKSREIYEAPAALVLYKAHLELERLTLDRETFHYKAKMANDYADLVYNGLWHSPLRSAMDAFIDRTQSVVNGLVKLKLYKGNIEVSGRTSPNSLYDTGLATYTEEDAFDHKASEGFIAIYALPLKTYHRVNNEAPNEVAK
ncbi:MAG: argininosuccinate synthase [Bacteroidetes bacterium]|nr:argininosuccinate synthase [Bacteroidota bacterium]